MSIFIIIIISFIIIIIIVVIISECLEGHQLFTKVFLLSSRVASPSAPVGIIRPYMFRAGPLVVSASFFCILATVEALAAPELIFVALQLGFGYHCNM